MTKKKLKYYEKRLLEERDKIMVKLASDQDNYSDLKKEEIGDIVDIAYQMWEKDRAIDISESDKQLLIQINNALQRIKNGTFGFCIKTGKEITEERLDAIPWALTNVVPEKKNGKALRH